MDQAAAELLRAVERLTARLAGATPAWYAAHPAGSRSRAQVLWDLVSELAQLGADAGTGQPPGAEPPPLGEHALADQLLVLTQELTTAPRAAQVAEAALTVVRAARDRL